MSEEEKYKKAINELADSYELYLKQWAKRCIDTINEYTTNLQQELQQKENIIKEVREKLLCYGETFDLKVHQQMQKELLKILDEEKV